MRRSRGRSPLEPTRQRIDARDQQPENTDRTPGRSRLRTPARSSRGSPPSPSYRKPCQELSVPTARSPRRRPSGFVASASRRSVQIPSTVCGTVSPRIGSLESGPVRIRPSVGVVEAFHRSTMAQHRRRHAAFGCQEPTRCPASDRLREQTAIALREAVWRLVGRVAQSVMSPTRSAVASPPGYRSATRSRASQPSFPRF